MDSNSMNLVTSNNLGGSPVQGGGSRNSVGPSSNMNPTMNGLSMNGPLHPAHFGSDSISLPNRDANAMGSNVGGGSPDLSMNTNVASPSPGSNHMGTSTNNYDGVGATCHPIQQPQLQQFQQQQQMEQQQFDSRVHQQQLNAKTNQHQANPHGNPRQFDPQVFQQHLTRLLMGGQQFNQQMGQQREHLNSQMNQQQMHPQMSQQQLNPQMNQQHLTHYMGQQQMNHYMNQQQTNPLVNQQQINPQMNQQQINSQMNQQQTNSQMNSQMNQQQMNPQMNQQQINPPTNPQQMNHQTYQRQMNPQMNQHQNPHVQEMNQQQIVQNVDVNAILNHINAIRGNTYNNNGNNDSFPAPTNDGNYPFFQQSNAMSGPNSSAGGIPQKSMTINIKTGVPLNDADPESFGSGVSNVNTRGGGNNSEITRSSSAPLLNEMLLDDDEEFLPASTEQPRQSRIFNPFHSKNVSGGNTDRISSRFSGTFNTADENSQPRRKSEPSHSIMDEFLGVGGERRTKDENGGNPSIAVDGWFSPHSGSPEPELDPGFFKKMKGPGRAERSNSEPLLSEMLYEALSDIEPESVFDEDEARSSRRRAKKKSNTFKRSHSSDGVTLHAENFFTVLDSSDKFPSEDLPTVEVSTFPDEDEKPLRVPEDSSEHDFCNPVVGEPSHFQSFRKVKGNNDWTGRRRGEGRREQKRSRSVDPIEMFSADKFLDGDDDDDDDDDDPFAYRSDPPDDLFQGMSPEEQQRLERMGIFSRNKPKRRRSAPMLSQFFGEFSDSDDDKEDVDQLKNDPFESFHRDVSRPNSDANATSTMSREKSHGKEKNNFQLINMLFGMDNNDESECEQVQSSVKTLTKKEGTDRSCSMSQNYGTSQVIHQKIPATRLQLKTVQSQMQSMQENDSTRRNSSLRSESSTPLEQSSAMSVCSGESPTQSVMSATKAVSSISPKFDSSSSMSDLLSAVKQTQNTLRTLHPMVIQSRDTDAMENIARAFEVTAASTNFLLSSDLTQACFALNEANVTIKKLEERLGPDVIMKAWQTSSIECCDHGVVTSSLGDRSCVKSESEVASLLGSNSNLQVNKGSAMCNFVDKQSSIQCESNITPVSPKSRKTTYKKKGGKAQTSSKKASKTSSKNKVPDLKDLPPQSSDDPAVIMSRLKSLMERTQMSQKQLQKFDKQNGLPKSHSQTMVNSNRSRKQLQKGVILKKWNGAPLISLEDQEQEKESTEGDAKGAADDKSECKEETNSSDTARNKIIDGKNNASENDTIDVENSTSLLSHESTEVVNQLSIEEVKSTSMEERVES